MKWRSERGAGVWKELPEKVFEADTITALKRDLDRCIGRKAMDQMRTGRTRTDGHLGWHGKVGPNGLFPCCMTL